MWARHVEGMIGLWLGCGWLIFGYTDAAHMANDLVCGTLVIFLSMISYSEMFRFFHLFNFLIGTWLIVWAVAGGRDIHYAPHQNYLVAGLLFMMLSLVPARTKRPPRAWERFLSEKEES